MGWPNPLYASLGRVGGSVKLEKLSTKEADSLSAFFRCNYVAEESVVITFADFSVALGQTRFTGMDVLDFLSAYHGSQLLTNEQVIKKKQMEKDKFFRKFMEEYPQIKLIYQKSMKGYLYLQEGLVVILML